MVCQGVGSGRFGVIFMCVCLCACAGALRAYVVGVKEGAELIRC
jgi:hypothetical protein